jgi:hypothetical protein
MSPCSGLLRFMEGQVYLPRYWDVTCRVWHCMLRNGFLDTSSRTIVSRAAASNPYSLATNSCLGQRRRPCTAVTRDWAARQAARKTPAGDATAKTEGRTRCFATAGAAEGGLSACTTAGLYVWAGVSSPRPLGEGSGEGTMAASQKAPSRPFSHVGRGRKA